MTLEAIIRSLVTILIVIAPLKLETIELIPYISNNNY